MISLKIAKNIEEYYTIEEACASLLEVDFTYLGWLNTCNPPPKDVPFILLYDGIHGRKIYVNTDFKIFYTIDEGEE